MLTTFAATIGTFVFASQIGIGLRDDVVSIQEYWQNGEAHYFVYNWTEEPVAISLTEYSAKKDVPGRPLAFWWIQPNDAELFPIAFDRIENYLSVAVGSGRPSVIIAPSSHDDVKWGGIATFGTTNHGGERFERFWIEQDSLIFRGGTNASVTLVIKSYSCEVAFGDYASLCVFGRAGRSLIPRNGFPRRPYVTPTNVTSRTLAVRREEGLFIVGAFDVLDIDGVRSPGWHEAKVEMMMPYVERLTPVALLINWRDSSGGSGWARRTILVTP